MELNKLYYFHTVAKHENITRAAEELYVSQPAVSKTIKSLENELGLPLFYKKGKNIHLTSFGEYLKSQTDKMFSIWNSTLTEMALLKHENDNSIRLNVLAATSIVTDAVLEYKKLNSDSIFHIIQNEEVDCDISVTTNSVDFNRLPSFSDRCIFEEKIYLATPKTDKYNTRTSISLEEVKDMGFVNLSGSRLFRVVCDKFCEAVGFTPNIIFESDAPSTVKNIIKTGVGIGFWPEFSWSEFPINDLNLIPISNPICQRELIVGLHTSAFSPQCVTDFYHFLLNFIKEKTKVNHR